MIIEWIVQAEEEKMPSALRFWLERHGPASNLHHNLSIAEPKLLRALAEVYLIHGFMLFGLNQISSCNDDSW